MGAHAAGVMARRGDMSFSAKIAALVAVVLILSSCDNREDIQLREQFWREKLEHFAPVGKIKAELFEWQKNNDVPLNSFPNEEGVILESIEGDGFVCATWHVLLSTKLDSKGRIVNYAVTSAGSCL